MALPATLVWEIRPTNGATDGGGGVDSALVPSIGTDYSQQDAVQVAYTDLVVGTPNTDVTSVATPFTSAHVGNNIAITTTGGGAAWTTGIYNIRSVTSGVATLDRSPAATASTAGVGNLGGARKLYSTGVNTLQASLVAGNIVFVKNEAWSETVALTVAGTSALPIWHIGYNTSTSNRTITGSDITGFVNTNNPVNDPASGNGFNITTGSLNHFRNINVTGATDGFNSASGSPINLFVNCKAYSNTSDGWGRDTGAPFWGFIGCEASSNSASGVSVLGGNSQQMFGSYLHDNTSTGLTSVGATCVFSIFDSNAAHNASLAAGNIYFVNNTVYNASGASQDGMNATAPINLSMMFNNIFASNARYGANCSTDGDSLYSDFNDYNANGTAARNNVMVGPNDSTAAPGFTDAGAGNFAIDTTLKALGFPGAFPGGTSTGALDMGAVQRIEAGGGGLLTHPGMGGGMRG